MARRRKPRNNAVPAHRGKGARKRRNVFIGDRNRASPAPVIKLYDSLSEHQKNVIVNMGQGSFLDIKCEQLHNPVINWFAKCYQPSTRSFVIPCRGTIPLSEESVLLMMGLPRGPLVVKYYADHALEAEVAARLFPGLSSRPKVSEIGTRIAQYNDADNTFRELWMCFIISTIVAPTTDTKMSNKCYPMLGDVEQAHEMNLCKFVVDELHENLSKGKYTKGCLLYCMLRYFSALDTDHMELELGNAQFAINKWTKVAVDVIGEMDAQGYDSTIFGSMELKDEFKDVVARGMSFFGGPDGFNSWMDQNTHPTCTAQRRSKVSSLIQTFASNLNGLLSELVQGLTESNEVETNAENDDGDSSSEDDVEGSSQSESDEEQERVVIPPVTQDVQQNHRKGKEVATTDLETQMEEGQGEGSTSTSVPPMHSQIFLPSDSELDVSDEGVEQGAGISAFSRDSPIQTSQIVNEQIRGSAASLAARLRNLKQQPLQSKAEELATSNKIKLIVARELKIPVSSNAYETDGSKMHKTVIEQEESALNKLIPSERDDVPISSTGVDVQFLGSNSTHQKLQEPAPSQSEGTSSSKRKRKSSLSISPTRKSPRFVDAKVKGDNVVEAPADGNKLRPAFVVLPKLAKRRLQHKDVRITEEGKDHPDADGKTKGTAIAISPTVMNPPMSSKAGIVSGASKSSLDGDGKTKSSAIPISPTVIRSPVASHSSGSKSTTVSDGKTKTSAIPISPTVADNAASSSTESKSAPAADGKSKSNAIAISPTITKDKSTGLHPSENMCRSIVLSPTTQVNSQTTTPLSPFVVSKLRNVGLGRDNLSCSAIDLEQLVRNLSESVKKHGILSKYGGPPISMGGKSGIKRKKKSSSSGKERDNRPGMFTPPGFDLGISSQETSDMSSQEATLSDCPLADVGSQEDARPVFALDVAPLAWAQSQDKGEPNVAADIVGGDSDLEQFELTEEVQNFIANKSDFLSENGKLELTKYEDFCRAFAKRRRILQEAAAPQVSKVGSAIHSITPKVNPQKVRIRNPSRFVQSSFHPATKVTAEEESVYQKVMLSSKHHRPSRSNIKKYQIIKYPNSWVYTCDLADSIHARGELSNHCMEVAIEYLQSTNNVEGKLIMPYQLSLYLLAEDYQKRLVVSIFKRRIDYSLSVMKLISFPVLQEAERGSKEGNHWYVMCLNFEAGRFEALDSMRGEDSVSLKAHANTLIKNIKAIWDIHYADSKVQIQDYDLQIINIPKQVTNFDCGFHAVYNIQKWDGQNIPPVNSGDIANLRKILPYKFITADINESKDWKWHLDNNKLR